MKVASDVLLLLCLHDSGLRVIVEVGQASAFLYSEARLYKSSILCSCFAKFGIILFFGGVF